MAASAARRHFLSLTTYFFHPDIEMKTWEVLSRGTATLLTPPPAAGAPQQQQLLLLLASHHVTHPHRFPQYYPRDDFAFMQLLEDKHVRCSVELREVRACGAERRGPTRRPLARPAGSSLPHHTTRTHAHTHTHRPLPPRARRRAAAPSWRKPGYHGP